MVASSYTPLSPPPPWPSLLGKKSKEQTTLTPPQTPGSQAARKCEFQSDMRFGGLKFDIFYNHGLIGFIVFFTVFLYVIYHIEKERIKKSFSRYMYNFDLILIVLLSFFTGHILIAPAVSILVIAIILKLNYEEKAK